MSVVPGLKRLGLLPADVNWVGAAPAIRHEVDLLLQFQAACLDQKDWAAFIELFADDGLYWMPANPRQTTHEGQVSIFAEDRDAMGLRARRMSDATAWSMAPRWGTSHLVGGVMVFSDPAEPATVTALSRFQVTELRRDAVRTFTGSYCHHLAASEAGGYRIRLQRVDLLTAETPFDYVLQAWL
ncbi:MAG: aromatic-ring-hydroxylating dioxygenase subunit beta [Lautropia sp.]